MEIGRGMSEELGDSKQDVLRTPGSCGTSLPQGRWRRPHRHYSLESEADHAQPAETAKPDGKEREDSPGTAAKRASAPFKDSRWAWPMSPAPAPPRPARRIPGSSQERWGRLARGLLAASLWGRDRETKGRIPPLPALSRPPGIFPRPGPTRPPSPRDPAVSRSS